MTLDDYIQAAMAADSPAKRKNADAQAKLKKAIAELQRDIDKLCASRLDLYGSPATPKAEGSTEPVAPQVSASLVVHKCKCAENGECKCEHRPLSASSIASEDLMTLRFSVPMTH